MLFSCFRRPRSSKDEGEALLAPRLISYSNNAINLEDHLHFKQNHNARVLEAHTQHQAEINLVIERLDSSISSPTPPSPPAELVQLQHFDDARTYHILSTRPRRSDPPNLEYERYEIWDKVQKENYSVGGRDLEWKTGVVDLRIEADLLDDYIGWVRERREELGVEGSMIKGGAIRGGKRYKSVNRSDRQFFANLEHDLLSDFRQTARETWRHDERWGKEAEDSGVIWDLVERLEREEGERKRKEAEARMQ